MNLPVFLTVILPTDQAVTHFTSYLGDRIVRNECFVTSGCALFFDSHEDGGVFESGAEKTPLCQLAMFDIKLGISY